MTVLERAEVHEVDGPWHEDPWAGVPVIGGAAPGAGDPGGETPVPCGQEAVAVRCDAVGNPCVLLWRGREHRVLQPVIHCFERRNWWDVADRVPRESRTSAVDRERWRVQAVQAGASVVRTFELTRNQFTGQWELLRAGF